MKHTYGLKPKDENFYDPYYQPMIGKITDVLEACS